MKDACLQQYGLGNTPFDRLACLCRHLVILEENATLRRFLRNSFSTRAHAIVVAVSGNPNRTARASLHALVTCGTPGARSVTDDTGC